ncbi:A/G-specific adenine glycosylase [Nocardioides sp. 616]|uniref:A/G-specific adenine glycosylase n=1 Tax=Nocardioides sp. 616 TaxID=2268090 RepID=UPI000CE44127|nr:A/G-specific adenine glycosylase [Nocardioides sp. 616]
MSALHGPILDWYDDHARDLPWRTGEASPWSVMVSEFMLQQTPVARVLPVHQAWLERWPTPALLAREPVGEALRMWGRLGYPRRALRLHASAVAICERHGGEVPTDRAQLLALPGVGDYTSAAIAAFAFGQRHEVLDTNVRRVFARALLGEELAGASVTRGERVAAQELLPQDPATAATWSVAVMELGALVCRATKPDCGSCPVADLCAWRAAGHPAYDGPPRRGQAWAGTDRQCRGRIMAVLRDSPGPVAALGIEAAWHDPEQRERCLAALVVDGLVVPAGDLGYRLP